jgi:hypothetical protein
MLGLVSVFDSSFMTCCLFLGHDGKMVRTKVGCFWDTVLLVTPKSVAALLNLEIYRQLVAERWSIAVMDSTYHTVSTLPIDSRKGRLTLKWAVQRRHILYAFATTGNVAVLIPHELWEEPDLLDVVIVNHVSHFRLYVNGL